jgi:hypothetical protein
MGWDNSRPVPYQRLIREWLIYAAIMSAVFVIFFRGGNVVGAVAGVLISGPLYVGLGAVMAKFGYQRQRLKDVRPKDASAVNEAGDTSSAPAAREKPAPTSRTAGGGNRPQSKRKR